MLLDSLLDFLLHLLNLTLPAIFVAFFLTYAAPLLWRDISFKIPRHKAFLIGCAAGVGTLFIGLMLHSVDGKITTYSAMLIVQTLWQLWVSRV